MKTFKNLLLVALFFATATVMGQTKITGKVVDETNEPLPSASIVVKGTTNGTTTDFDGKFMLNTKTNSGVLVISFVGYKPKEVVFSSTKRNLGTIQLAESGDVLDEIVVIGKGVIDLAGGRKTPIAVSTLKAAEIQAKTGTSDLPEILKSTPSVQSIQRGGYGDGRLYLRGFDQTNTAFLLNGQPINGMEDGKMYWSNWSGVLDIANAVQVQRGLGASKLAISSVGGTVNIVTKTVDTKKGGNIRFLTGNDAYVKTTAYYSTGLMENGFAFAGMIGHWQGNGYMQGTKGQGQTYFLSFGYKPNDSHIFNLLVTGAPQWHGAAGGSKLSKYLDKGRRYSNWWGYYKGKEYSGGRNFYHKPVINLSWDWTITETSKLSTVAYASFGRGGFAYPQGRGFYGFRDSDGLLDYDAIEKDNINTGGSKFVKASVNSHNWYGIITNFEKKFSDNLSMSIGLDGRFYNGIHYRAVTESLGATINVTSKYGGNYTINKEIGYNPWSNLFSSTGHKDRFSYDYQEKINYIGAFGQIEYSNDRIATYFQGAISNQSHKKTDTWNYSSAKSSDKLNNIGYNLKAGGSYTIDDDNKVFVNAGYYSRQAFHDDLFTNIRKSNELNPYGNKNQTIIGFEGGYQFKSEKVSVNLNLYSTSWDNRILSSAQDTNNDNVSDEFTQSSGIKEIHQGIELEFFTRPTEKLKINGFLSVGNWKYKGNVETKTYDDNGTLLKSGEIAYIDGVKIGNAAQFTAGLNANYKITEKFSADANYNFYNNLYSQINLGSREFETQKNKGALKLPSYNTVDLGASYKLNLGGIKNQSFTFRINVNNIFNTFYIENSKTNKFVASGDKTWKGINTSNKVYIGYGTTWNFGVKYMF